SSDVCSSDLSCRDSSSAAAPAPLQCPRRNRPGSPSKPMPADTALYRHSGKFFVAFLALTVLAFWPSYFERLFEQPNIRFHLHGAALFLWCAMLVAQAQLIRTRRRALHRQVGRASYVLAPVLIAI